MLWCADNFVIKGLMLVEVTIKLSCRNLEIISSLFMIVTLTIHISRQLTRCSHLPWLWRSYMLQGDTGIGIYLWLWWNPTAVHPHSSTSHSSRLFLNSKLSTAVHYTTTVDYPRAVHLWGYSFRMCRVRQRSSFSGEGSTCSHSRVHAAPVHSWFTLY